MVLINKGYHVQNSPGRGVALGARLTIEKSGDPQIEVAVRTSARREISLLRSATGAWRTVNKVKLVVVSVPSRDDPDKIEVMAFEAEYLIAQFDAFIALKEGKNPSESLLKAPVFLGLDTSISDETQRHPCLSDQALWKITLAADQSFGEEKPSKLSMLIGELKKEFAAITGVDEASISVELRIVA